MNPGRVRRIVSVVTLLALGCATGCKNFFSPNTGTGGTVNTGDYAYVVNAYTSTTTSIYTLSGLSVGTGTLTALSGFPLTLQFAPASVVVTPANSFVYVAGAGVIYGYTIGTGGALTQLLSSTNSAALENAEIVSMCVSPDGQWLLALDASTSQPIVDYYQIDSSTGQLTVETSVAYPFQGDAVIVPNSIRIAPTGTYVAASLGTGGDVLFGFNTTTGGFTAIEQVNTQSVSSADQALAFDSTASTLYIARSGTSAGVYPESIGTDGTLTQVSGAPFALGAAGTTFGPSSMLIDSTGKYLYVGNRTNSTISGFSIATGGVLTALSGSPYTSGSNINALAEDNSGTYILATAAGGGPDVEMFSFDATNAGKLDVATTKSTGDPTEPSGAMGIAMTH